MVRIPQFDEQPQQAQATSFQAPTTEPEALTFDRIQQSLGRWQERLWERGEQEAMETQQDRAAMAQEELGTEGIAQPDENLARRYQQAFEQRAQDIYNEQLRLDTQRTAAELRRNHWNDPEGFQNAWQEYRDTQRETIREQDPVLADDVGRYLDAFGNENFQKLMDNQHARERAAQKSDYVRIIEERQADMANTLLNEPDEEEYWGFLADIERDLDEAVESGILGAQEAAQLRGRNRVRMTGEYVRGTFRESLRNQDIGGARAVVESLRRGKWFEDNDRARALANELQQQLGGLEESANTDVSRELGRLSRGLNATQRGQEVSIDELMPSVEFVFEHGNPNQQEQARTRLNAIALTQEVKPYVEETPITELGALKRNILTQWEDLPASALTLMDDVIDSRVQEINEAVDRGDWLGVAGDVGFERWADRIAASDNPAQEIGEFRAELEGRRARAEHITEMDAPVGMGLFSQAEANDAASRFQDALNNDRMDAADNILTTYMGVYAGQPLEATAAALRLGDESGDMFTAAMLTQFGEVDDVTDMLALSREGRAVDRSSVRNRVNIHEEDLDRNDAIVRAMDALSMGRPQLRSRIRGAMENIMFAEADRTGDRREALRRVEKILAPLTDTVQFANGQRLPSMMVAEYGVDTIKDEINGYLNHPARLGMPNAPDEDLRWITPHPMEDGSIGFFHTSQNRLINAPETGDPVRINVPDVLEREQVERPDPDARGWFGAAEDAINRAVTSVTDFLQIDRLQRPARHFGVEDDLMEALYYGAKQTPVEHGGARIHEVMLRPNAENEVDWDAVSGAWRDLTGVAPQHQPEATIMSSGQAPYAAAQLMSQYQQEFRGDEQAALAAYWEGPEVVHELQREFGDAWFDELPMEAQKFIGRVEEHRERIRGRLEERERRRQERDQFLPLGMGG